VGLTSTNAVSPCSVLHCVTVCCGVLECVAVCSVQQCAAVWLCSVLLRYAGGLNISACGESCHAYEWVTLHTSTSPVMDTYSNDSGYVWRGGYVWRWEMFVCGCVLFAFRCVGVLVWLHFFFICVSMRLSVRACDCVCVYGGIGLRENVRLC